MRQATPEQVAQIVELAAGVTVALQGGLDSEIKRYTALKAEADAKVKAVGGLAAAEKVIADAEAKAAEVRKESDERAQGTKDAAKSLQEWNDRLASKQAEFDKAAGLLAQSQARHAEDKARWTSGIEDQERRLALKEAGLKAREEANDRERQILAERERKLNERLEALKVPV